MLDLFHSIINTEKSTIHFECKDFYVDLKPEIDLSDVSLEDVIHYSSIDPITSLTCRYVDYYITLNGNFRLLDPQTPSGNQKIVYYFCFVNTTVGPNKSVICDYSKIHNFKLISVSNPSLNYINSSDGYNNGSIHIRNYLKLILETIPAKTYEELAITKFKSYMKEMIDEKLKTIQLVKEHLNLL